MYEYKAKITRVVDGDTLHAEIDLGFGVTFKEVLRLARINTPEIHGVKKESVEYQAGMKSKEFVVEWLDQRNYEVVIRTDKDKKGKYGRYIAEVFDVSILDATEDNTIIVENLNDILLSEGLAALYD